jgi:hypothetical protein
VISRLEYGAKGDNPRYIVANLAGDIRTLYEDGYCARRETENRIKEIQSGLFSGKSTQCSRNTGFATSNPHVAAFISGCPSRKWRLLNLHFGTLMPYGEEDPCRPRGRGGIQFI